MRVRHRLLADHLSILEGVARADRATRMLVLKLLDTLAVLKHNPNIDTPISVGITFLPLDLSIGIEDSQVEDAICICIPLFTYHLVVFENVNRVPIS